MWRCDLDGKNLELIADNFRNSYEPCVDSFGTVFLSDNDDDGNQQTRICYVMPGGNYGYHHNPRTSHWNEEHPGIVPKILRTYFGSPTGMCVYEGTLLAKKYQGQLLHVDAGPRHVRSYQLAPSGASYSVKREDIVQSTDSWFRPSDICVAPDGSVYVADWYDPGVGGHGMGDTTRGRIYRLAPTNHKPDVPAVDLETTKGLTRALASPNLAVRAVAMARLREQGLPKALEVLEPADLQKDNPGLRARSLWQLGYLGNLRHVTRAFEDPDPNFRILAMRILSDCQKQSPIDYIPDWQKRILYDPSAAVRREALVLLQKADPQKAGPMILELAKQYDGKDRFYLAAVGIAVGHYDQKRRETILAEFNNVFPEINDKVAGLIWELQPPGIVPLLAKRLGDSKLTDNQRGPIFDILLASPDKQAGPIVLQALALETSVALRDKILTGMSTNMKGNWKLLAKSPEMVSVIKKLLEASPTRNAGLALIGLTRSKEFQNEALRFAGDSAQPLDVRRAALRALGSLPTDEAGQGAFDIYSKEPTPELRLEALSALGRQGTAKARKLLKLVVQAKIKPLDERQAAAAGLAATNDGANLLLQLYRSKELANDLTADLARLLRNSTYKDVRRSAASVLPAPPKLDPARLPSIPALLARKGNIERGYAVLEKTLKNDAACLKCHTINKVGGAVGPDLSVIGSKASRENLLESILYPSRAIADQYIQWIVETKSGQVINGIVIEETPDYLLLRDVNVKDHKVPRADIESKTKSPKSLMPDNLLSYLSEEDLLDVIEYLYSLKTPTLAP